MENIDGRVEDEDVSGCAARSRLPNRKRRPRDRRHAARGVPVVGEFGHKGGRIREEAMF